MHPFYRMHILNGKLLLYSHVSPLALNTRNSFVSSAMERNKYIYASSKATVVVRSDKEQGGTWAGATECLKHKWSPVFVWDHKEYAGNQKLIEMGAMPLSDEGKRIKNEPGSCASGENRSDILNQTPHQISMEEYQKLL